MTTIDPGKDSVGLAGYAALLIGASLIIIRLFLEDLPVRLAAIQVAVTSRNAVALRSGAHALKGSAGNLAVGGLFEAASVLERIGKASHLDAADAAWRQLSVEAASVIDVLSRYTASTKERYPCAS